MSNEIYLSDNAGHRVSPINAPDPIPATGQTISNIIANTDSEVTVVGGAKYAFTAQEIGGFYFGLENIELNINSKMWCCPIYETIIIVVPLGVISLHYAVDVNNAIGYLRRLTE